MPLALVSMANSLSTASHARANSTGDHLRGLGVGPGVVGLGLCVDARWRCWFAMLGSSRRRRLSAGSMSYPDRPRFCEKMHGAPFWDPAAQLANWPADDARM